MHGSTKYVTFGTLFRTHLIGSIYMNCADEEPQQHMLIQFVCARWRTADGPHSVGKMLQGNMVWPFERRHELETGPLFADTLPINGGAALHHMMSAKYRTAPPTCFFQSKRHDLSNLIFGSHALWHFPLPLWKSYAERESLDIFRSYGLPPSTRSSGNKKHDPSYLICGSHALRHFVFLLWKSCPELVSSNLFRSPFDACHPKMELL